MRATRIASLVVLLAFPAIARAQDARLAERLDPATASDVQEVVDSAASAGLPTEPLVQKALEGSTLGANGNRILAAVQALHGQLDRARDALGRDADDAELTAAAGALRAGLAPVALRRLQSLRSGRPLVVPIAVLTDLVAEGVPPEEATRSVLDLARDGRPDDEFVALRRQMQVRRRGAAGEPMGRPALRPAADPPVDR
ncbi:MAG TPA: hypothetical protein VHG35_00340 [Gemmatimonadales bacterium]|nr:hypothetical protein [Gemmatimonadales bacterium]